MLLFKTIIMVKTRRPHVFDGFAYIPHIFFASVKGMETTSNRVNRNVVSAIRREMQLYSDMSFVIFASRFEHDGQSSTLKLKSPQFF